MSQPSSQKTKNKKNLQLIEKLVDLVDLVCYIEIELVSSVVIVYSLYGLV